MTITNTSATTAPSPSSCALTCAAETPRECRPGDNEVLPLIWSDNDMTLWPGESETLQVRYAAAALHGASPVITVAGQNIAAQHVPAR